MSDVKENEKSALPSPTPPEIIAEYTAIMSNLSSFNSRRHTTNDVFVGINVLFLTGIGFLLATSHLQSGWLIGAVALITLAVLPINLNWHAQLRLYRRLGRIDYDALIKLEKHYGFVTNFNQKLIEFPKGSTTALEINLVTYFIVIYPLVTLGVALLTFLVANNILPTVNF